MKGENATPAWIHHTISFAFSIYHIFWQHSAQYAIVGRGVEWEKKSFS
jgi:hypothetical protein